MSTGLEVAVVDTGTANRASVAAALQRAGARPFAADGARAVEQAPVVVLPGVGAFGAAMRQLVARDLVAPLRERLLARRPTLAICLGMQLWFDGSDESPGVAGLGIASGSVRRLAADPSRRQRVPHLGWSRVAPEPACTTADLPQGCFYFAHSYAALEVPSGFDVAFAWHGVRFVAALRRGPLLACQFHPELSGAAGQRLLTDFLDEAERCQPCG